MNLYNDVISLDNRQIYVIIEDIHICSNILQKNTCFDHHGPLRLAFLIQLISHRPRPLEYHFIIRMPVDRVRHGVRVPCEVLELFVVQDVQVVRDE